MSNIHERTFMLAMMDLDGLALNPRQRAELQMHLPGCADCRGRLRVHAELGREAADTGRAMPGSLLEGVQRHVQRRARLERSLAVLRLVGWAGLAVLILVAAQWMLTSLRPTPGVLPVASPIGVPTGAPESTPDGAPTPTPEGTVLPQIEPLVSGTPLGGTGHWSPDSATFFMPVQAPTDDPESDRQVITLHFILGATGRHCTIPMTFTGRAGFQNYAWLDNQHVLFIAPGGKPWLFQPCQDEGEDLSGLFDEPLLHIALPLINPQLGRGGAVLLESASTYWLMQAEPQTVRRLADPLPTPDLLDNFAWLPSGEQLSILQPLPDKPGRGRLVVLDLASGAVQRSLEIESIGESTPLIEWMGADRAFVWNFSPTGPALVDLSADPPTETHVLPEMFSLEITYPDQINSMGVFYDAAGDVFYIVVHANLPGNNSIYLYRSQSGQVEKLDGSPPLMMIFPGDQRMPLAEFQDNPTYEDNYRLMYVDAAEGQVQIHVAGHVPRSYPNLQSRLLPGGRMLFSSTQGVSLVSLPDGGTLAFWRLAGSEEAILPSLLPAPDGSALIVMADQPAAGSGTDRGLLIYWIGLEQAGAGGNP